MEDLFVFGAESSSERNNSGNSSPATFACASAQKFVDMTWAMELNIPYAIMEVLVAIFAVFGNGLVIVVFFRERRLRRRTNFYIVSLAVADLMFGLFGIPIAILVKQIKA